MDVLLKDELTLHEVKGVHKIELRNMIGIMDEQMNWSGEEQI